MSRVVLTHTVSHVCHSTALWGESDGTHPRRRWAAGRGWRWWPRRWGPCTSSCSSGRACWRRRAAWRGWFWVRAAAAASTPCWRWGGSFDWPRGRGWTSQTSRAWRGSVWKQGEMRVLLIHLVTKKGFVSAMHYNTARFTERWMNVDSDYFRFNLYALPKD